MLEVSSSRPAKKIASMTLGYQIPSWSLITLSLFSTFSTVTSTLFSHLKEGWCFKIKLCTSDFTENRFKCLVKLVWYSQSPPFTWGEFGICLISFWRMLCHPFHPLQEDFVLKLTRLVPRKWERIDMKMLALNRQDPVYPVFSVEVCVYWKRRGIVLLLTFEVPH